MSFFISFLLEPLSLLLYLTAISLLYFKFDRSFRNRVLIGYYLVISILMAKTFRIPNIQIYNILYIFTSLALGYYFYSLLRVRKIRFIIAILSLMPLVYYITNNTVFEGEVVFDSIGYVISSTGVLIMVFLYLRYILANVNEKPLILNFDFWFICSQLIYHLGAFGIFLTYSYFTKKILPSGYYSPENRLILTYLWGVHNVLLFLSSLITCTGILWIAYSRKSSLS